MTTKKPTTVIAIRAPSDLVDTIRQVAAGRNITVNELLRNELMAKYYCGPSERKSLQNVQPSDDELGDAFE